MNKTIINDNAIKNLFRSEPNSIFEQIFFYMSFFFSITFITSIIIFGVHSIYIGITLFCIYAMMRYINEEKKFNTVAGKIFIDSVTYTDGFACSEQIPIKAYEMVDGASIGVKDKSLYVSRVYEDDGKSSYYVSEHPLIEEMLTAIPISTAHGKTVGSGFFGSFKLIDIVFDPNTQDMIPVKLLLASPKMAEMKTVELEELPFKSIQVVPEIEVKQQDHKYYESIKTWTIKCDTCGAILELSNISDSKLGMFIECIYCGSQNGIRQIK